MCDAEQNTLGTEVNKEMHLTSNYLGGNGDWDGNLEILDCYVINAKLEIPEVRGTFKLIKDKQTLKSVQPSP